MKKHLLPITSAVMLCIFALISGCCTKKQTVSTIQKEGISSKEKLWGVDCSVIEKSKKITVFRLKALEETISTDASIAGFKLSDEGRVLNNQQSEVLKFILLSPLSYKEKNNIVYRKPFAPYFAFEFKNGNELLYLLVDISSDEWAISNKEKVLQESFTTNRKALVQLGNDIFPDDSYIQSIIKNIKENE